VQDCPSPLVLGAFALVITTVFAFGVCILLATGSFLGAGETIGLTSLS
jgi:hypothetical protein